MISRYEIQGLIVLTLAHIYNQLGSGSMNVIEHWVDASILY